MSQKWHRLFTKGKIAAATVSSKLVFIQLQTSSTDISSVFFVSLQLLAVAISICVSSDCFFLEENFTALFETTTFFSLSSSFGANYSIRGKSLAFMCTLGPGSRHTQLFFCCNGGKEEKMGSK